jgi:hypothetical protein
MDECQLQNTPETLKNLDSNCNVHRPSVHDITTETPTNYSTVYYSTQILNLKE